MWALNKPLPAGSVSPHIRRCATVASVAFRTSLVLQSHYTMAEHTANTLANIFGDLSRHSRRIAANNGGRYRRRCSPTH